MNRGLARRPVFDTSLDAEDFLDRAATLARSGRWEVHAFCLLPNHFHLLIRSLDGKLPEHMALLQRGFVRGFNRRRGRDGPLFRGRYSSQLIDGEDETYWRAVVRYIDHNSVAAGLARRPSDFPWGSAFHYAHSAGPEWLTRRVVEGAVADALGREQFRPGDYDDAFGPYVDIPVQGLDDPVQTGRRRKPDQPSSGLLDLASPWTRGWLDRRTILADGNSNQTISVNGSRIQEALAAARSLHPRGRCGERRWARSWARVETGMLRALAGWSQAEVARQIGRSPGDVSSLDREDQALRRMGDPRHQTLWAAALDTLARIGWDRSMSPKNSPSDPDTSY